LVSSSYETLTQYIAVFHIFLKTNKMRLFKIKANIPQNTLPIDAKSYMFGTKVPLSGHVFFFSNNAYPSTIKVTRLKMFKLQITHPLFMPSVHKQQYHTANSLLSFKFIAVYTSLDVHIPGMECRSKVKYVAVLTQLYFAKSC
jgi:hypothetical protein